MKKIFIFLVLIFVAGSSYPQSQAGITHLPDTSYSNYSAFISTKKSFPEIELVTTSKIRTIKEKKGISYCKQDSFNLSLDAFYPKKRNGAASPAIIIIHGGGWRSGNRSQHHPLAQQLAALGYACFTPQYRLSTDALFPAAVLDIKAAIRWVKMNAGKYHVDTSRIVILGFSAGGELAAFVGNTNGNAEFEGGTCCTGFSSAVQAIIDIDGTLSFVHPESGEGDDSKKTSSATYWLGYAKKDNPALWEKASPLSYAGANTPPTLFINSSVARMHAGREDYIKILTGFNIYTEVKSFENSPHGFCLFKPWFEPTVKYIDGFMKKIFLKKIK